ncbi:MULTISPECIES: YicC/YloC family endoribonuclease [Oleiagrimonas]|uniref:YicC family protein n=1 Tax=Oleiagrimonas citrea TaxID=1665687 RepID=A0A846ZN42_9GAMM|nr:MULTISPECIES: YicC/YloC family endoribonuclease [Oleiagrimonas]NKZ39386.1 YicC family protein [Oleiagrimonas citrea]RAP59630.1 YicC family protein [Oleiagrimonas sp. MCCC 1A03011]
MIRSMTAYASAESSGPLGTLACEVRTVNHRYLEQSPRLPDELRAFEPLLREIVSRRLSRGKVDVTVRLRGEDRSDALEVNHTLLARLAELHLDMAARFPGLQAQSTELLRFPGVLKQPEVDRDALQKAFSDALEEALDALTATREREGAKLAALIAERLDGIEKIVAEVRTMMPDIRTGLRTRLETRLADIKQPADPGRLEQELVLQITRADVDEELDRLDAHIAEARRVLGLDEPVGRRLDFLMQEFNREANTLGSKAVDTRSTNAAVELKVLIEQMREQVQNIE